MAEKCKKKLKPFRKTPSEAPRSSRGQHSKFFLDKRYGKSRQKIFDGNYRSATGRSSGFQGKNKHKGNLLQHVVSTYNSNRRSEECSSMGKKLVLCKNSSKLATSRKVKAFLKAWEILTKDPEILEIVKGFKIPFLKNPTQERVPQTSHMGHEQADLIHVKIENMLKKGAIHQTEHQVGEFLSNIFFVGKKDEGNRPVVNLRYLNQFIPYQHFKMEGLFCLRELLQERGRLHVCASWI